MNQSDLTEQFATAKKELAKLPMLGPVMFLYTRDSNRRFTFVADMDWRLLPPMILNQSVLYNKHDMPWAYYAWAFVSEAVDERLKSATPVIAPHEWKSGSIPWIIDAVSPYQPEPELLKQTVTKFAPGKTVNALVFDAQGALKVQQVQG